MKLEKAYVNHYNYESERNNNFIRLYGIGRILIDIESYPQKRIKPDFVKIINKKRKWYAKLP